MAPPIREIYREFMLRGWIFIFICIKMTFITFIKKIEVAVAIAAPNIPYKGIIIQLSKMVKKTRSNEK